MSTGSFPFYDATTIISRFTNDVPSDNTISLATEEVLFTLSQPFNNHNGGSIVFGNDDMLYIALGDGGVEPVDAESLDTTSLFGKILRIDVHGTPDPGLAYRIPPDNPYAGGTGPDPSTREEIFASGLRNPFRMSVDPATGVLYAGDVGESTWEEIDILTSGGNFGWPIMEGNACSSDIPGCNNAGMSMPAAQHGRSESIAIIGGHVYRGSSIPSLVGTYIYTDWIFGNIWGLDFDGTQVGNRRTLASGLSGGFVSLGQDQAGEVYLLDGGIWTLAEPTPGPPANFPDQLSDIPALLSAGLGQDQTAQGIIPYEPSAKLYSDGAIKERFIALPGTTQVDYTASGGWDFPEDTVLIKNFLLPQDFRDPEGTALRIETRLMVRNSGEWHGFSFEWNGAETDATLLEESNTRSFNLIDENGDPFTYEWYYPGRSDCGVCHNDAANSVLGLTTSQMNYDLLYPASGVTDNQLRTLDHIGLFSGSGLPDVPAALPKSPDPFDTGAGSVRERALSYMNANCAICHQPGGPANSSMDLRWDIPMASRNMMDVVPGSGTLGITDARLVAPGDPDRSVLVARMEDLGGNRMPPLASSRLDDDAIALIRAWVTSAEPLVLQDTAQQSCITQMNKAGAKVSATQSKEWLVCMKRAAAGQILSVDACVTGDLSGKVARARSKVTAVESGRCLSTPDFGFSTATAVGDAAVNHGVALERAVFGADLDAAVLTQAGDPAGARCQSKVAKRYEKLLATWYKEFSKCKKLGLKRSTIASSEGMEACLTGLTSALSSKVRGAVSKVTSEVTRSCDGLNTAVMFPGNCSAAPFQAVGSCIAEQAACEVCGALNEMDAMNVACDAFDDGESNASCSY